MFTRNLKAFSQCTVTEICNLKISTDFPDINILPKFVLFCFALKRYLDSKQVLGNEFNLLPAQILLGHFLVIFLINALLLKEQGKVCFDFDVTQKITVHTVYRNRKRKNPACQTGTQSGSSCLSQHENGSPTKKEGDIISPPLAFEESGCNPTFLTLY